MSRMSVLAIAAVAAFGVSAIAATDASAMFAGGRLGGSHGGSVGRTTFHPGNHGGIHRIGNNFRPGVFRPGGRKIIVDRFPRRPGGKIAIETPGQRLGGNPNGNPNDPPPRLPPPPLLPPPNDPPPRDPPKLPPPWVRDWCHHHHHHHHHWYPWQHWCHGWGFDVYASIEPIAASAPVCANDCDYFLNDGTGCYMAKRKFSTPQGDELRCVKLCDEPDVK